MKHRRWQIGAVAALGAAAALTGLVTLPDEGRVPLVVWYEGRAEQMSPLVEQAKTLIPGYEIQLVNKGSFETLVSSWEQADDDELPDVIVGHADLATDGYREGRVTPPAFDLDAGVFAPELTAPVTVDGDLIAVPFDTDIMLFVWNTELFGAKAPGSLSEMTEWYAKQPAGSAGLCVEQGVWGAQPLIDALGGTPWSDDTDPDLRSTGVGSAEFVERYVSVNSAGDGKFVTQDCFGSFESGKVPFALVGNWRLGSFDDVKYEVAAFPGIDGAPGRPWLTSSVAVMSSQAQERGRSQGAQALLAWFGSRDGQLQMGTAAQRLPARSDAIVSIGGVFSPEIVAMVGNGRPQMNEELLGADTGGGWFDVLAQLFPERGSLTPAEIPDAARAVREALIEQAARKR